MLGEERVSELEGRLSELLEERVEGVGAGPFGNEASKAHMSSIVNDVLLSLLESYTPTGLRVLLTKVKDVNNRIEFEEFLDSIKVEGAEDLRPHLFRLWMCLHNGNTKKAEVEKLRSYDARVTRPIFNQKLRQIIDYVLENCCPRNGFLELNEEADTNWRVSVGSSAAQQELENSLAAREFYTADLFSQIELANSEDLIFNLGIISVLQTLSIEDIHNSILIHYSKEIPGPRSRRTTLFQLIEATMPASVQTLFREIESRQFQLYIANPNAPETQYIRNSFFDLYGSFIGWRLCRRNYELADIASEEVEPQDVRINGDTLGFVLDKLYTTHPPAFHTLYAYIKAKGWKADLVDNIANAIVRGNFQFAKLIIEISKHLDRPLFDGNHLVHLAAMHGFVGVIAKLHEYGANLGLQRAGDRKSAYHVAIESDQLDDLRVVQVIERLKICMANIDAIDSSGATPLTSSITRVGRVNSGLKLIAMGADVTIGQSAPLTCLLDSKTQFSIRLYKALIEAKANLYVYPQRNGMHINGVMIAILSRFQVIAKLEALTPILLATPESVNRQVDSAGSSYLHWLLDVTTDEHIEADLASLKFLVTKGLDLNRPNLLGYSVLDQVVIDSKHIRFFVYLVENGVKFSSAAKNHLKAQVTGPKQFYLQALDARLEGQLTDVERANIQAFKMEITSSVHGTGMKRSGDNVAVDSRESNQIKRSR